MPTIVEQMATEREIRLTDSEITAACAALDLPRPMTLPGSTAPDGVGSNSTPVLAEPWGVDLMRTLARPSAVAFAHCRESGSPVQIHVYAVCRPWAAEQVPEASSVYALSLFDSGAVLDKMSAFCHLHERTRPESRPCEVSGGAFLRAMDQAGEDPARAAGLLRSDGLTTTDARVLAEAMSTWERMAQVTVLRRPDPTVLEGTTVAWFDAGAGGLWQVVAPKLATSGDYGEDGEALVEAALVVVQPTSKAELISEIQRGLAN